MKKNLIKVVAFGTVITTASLTLTSCDDCKNYDTFGTFTNYDVWDNIVNDVWNWEDGYVLPTTSKHYSITDDSLKYTYEVSEQLESLMEIDGDGKLYYLRLTETAYEVFKAENGYTDEELTLTVFAACDSGTKPSMTYQFSELVIEDSYTPTGFHYVGFGTGSYVADEGNPYAITGAWDELDNPYLSIRANVSDDSYGIKLTDYEIWWVGVLGTEDQKEYHDNTVTSGLVDEELFDYYINISEYNSLGSNGKVQGMMKSTYTYEFYHPSNSNLTFTSNLLTGEHEFTRNADFYFY